jgi:hypothetical protein
MIPGPVLAIRGTFVGATLLSLFLFAVSAGAAYPPLADRPIADQPAGSDRLKEAVASSSDSTTIRDVPPSDCAVSASFPPSILQWCALITQYAQEHGLAPDLVAALIWQESGGDPLAYSRSGAVGLMQVMPSDGLAAGFMCANGPCFSSRPSTQELQDPEFNIAYGTRMLAGLLAKNGGLREALKAYGPMSVGYSYADKVMGIYQNYQK